MQTTKSVPRDVPVSSGLAIAVLSVLAAMGTLATNILLPSLPQIAISLNVTSAAVTSAITVFLAVFGIGQLLVGPLSDRYGRRWPVLIGFAVFFGGSVWCGLAKIYLIFWLAASCRLQALVRRQYWLAPSPATCSVGRHWRARWR